MKTISILLAIICFAIILLVGILTDILREAKNETVNKKVEEKPYSFSRFQLWLWTLILGPAFILNWGFVNPGVPQVNITILILLGIPSSVALTAWSSPLLIGQFTFRLQ